MPKKPSGNLMKARYLILLMLLGIGFFATGWTDLDWMIVCYKYQFGQGLTTAVNWEFNPYWSVNWWMAYALSFWRVVLGAGLVGFVAGQLQKGNK